MHFIEIIKTIKERREVLQVTQETLAELSGVGLRTLKQLESGKGNPYSRSVKYRIKVLFDFVNLKYKNTTLSLATTTSIQACKVKCGAIVISIPITVGHILI